MIHLRISRQMLSVKYWVKKSTELGTKVSSRSVRCVSSTNQSCRLSVKNSASAKTRNKTAHSQDKSRSIQRQRLWVRPICPSPSHSPWTASGHSQWEMSAKSLHLWTCSKNWRKSRQSEISTMTSCLESGQRSRWLAIRTRGLIILEVRSRQDQLQTKIVDCSQETQVVTRAARIHSCWCPMKISTH